MRILRFKYTVHCLQTLDTGMNRAQISMYVLGLVICSALKDPTYDLVLIDLLFLEYNLHFGSSEPCNGGVLVRGDDKAVLKVDLSRCLLW